MLNETEKPTGAEFCSHFQPRLNPGNAIDPQQYIPHEYRYIPVLDDPIRLEEIEQCIHNLKPNKAADTDGITPGILKMLSLTWLILLTQIFNLVFHGS